MDKFERDKILLRRFDDIDYWSVAKELAANLDKAEKRIQELIKERSELISYIPED